MTTDIENELRELLRDKAGEAPVATPSAPPRVLRRGRVRQAWTVAGAGVLMLALIVGSVAGLTRILGDGRDAGEVGNGGYDVFERTATIEAFTVTSPSDWYLVNEWPLSMQIAIEGSSGTSGSCVAAPGTNTQECTSSTESSVPLPLPEGLPMIQLTNLDLGLETNACRDGIPSDRAALYVALDAERAIAGIADPSIPPFPPGVGLPPEGDGPCGPGRYARFTVNGEPFFAWIGLGSDVTDQDRETVETAYERMSAIDDWTPASPEHLTPGYVIAGGTTEAGEAWRIEARRPTDIELSLIVGRTVQLSLSTEPLEWQNISTDPARTPDVIFGGIERSVADVAFRPVDGQASIPGTIVPLPPSLGSSLDMFYIPGTTGLAGEVVPVGPDGGTTVPSPQPTVEPSSKVVSLLGGTDRHTWIVRFSGSFVDNSACIRVGVDTEALDSPCSIALASSLAYDGLSLQSWLTDSMYLLAGAKPVGDDVRFVRPFGGGVSEFECTTGPVGWPDRDVCVAILPPEAESRTLQYLDSDGNVLSEARATPWGEPADPVHGGSYWAVYPWIGAPGDPQADDVSAILIEQYEIEAFPGELGCDQGAAAALGRSDAEHAIGVYFETEQDADAFVVALDALDQGLDPVVAQVTTYCLD